MYTPCTHPDHNDHETCGDRAVGCSKHCICCMEELAIPLDGNVLSTDDILLIRACKTETRNNKKFFRRIFARRVDISVQHVNDRDVADWMLSVLIDNNLIRNMREFILYMNEVHDWMFITRGKPGYENYNDRLMGRCASALALTHVKHLNGYRSPSKFGRK